MLPSDVTPGPVPYRVLFQLGAKHTLKRALKLLPGVQSFARTVNAPTPSPSNGRCAIRDFFILKKMAERHGVTIVDKTVLEIGSGWFPIFSVLFAVYGARKIYVTDITAAMDAQTFSEALRFLPQGAAALVNEGHVTADEARFVTAKVQELSWEDGRFEYVAPFNPATSTLSVDLIVSRTVIEHIDERHLCATLQAFRRLLTAGGHMLHSIDNSDHISHGQKGISPVNFLTIPQSVWGVVNSLNYPQNRIRHDAYGQLFKQCGLEVLEARGQPHPKALNDLQKFAEIGAIDADFKFRHTLDGLAILDSYFLLRNSGHGENPVRSTDER